MDPRQIPEAWRETWEERAAICEYEGLMPRDEAERFALELVHAAVLLLARDARQRRKAAS